MSRVQAISICSVVLLALGLAGGTSVAAAVPEPELLTGEGYSCDLGPSHGPRLPLPGLQLRPLLQPEPVDAARLAWPLPYDPLYASSYYGLWQALLPTENMLENALLEGVLAEGGYVKPGFLYFQEVNEDLSRVTFTFELVDATTGERIGTIRIPFVVHEG